MQYILARQSPNKKIIYLLCEDLETFNRIDNNSFTFCAKTLIADNLFEAKQQADKVKFHTDITIMSLEELSKTLTGE